jgi:hypothetical protein
MRVEPAPYVFRNEDRRQRFEDRRTVETDRRAEAAQQSTRARHEAYNWLSPAFGAHILGQSTPARATPDEIRRAYAQPESRTPLRPEHIARA